MPLSKQFTALVVANKPVAADIYELVCAPVPAMQQAQPGQFVEVAVSATLDPLLRRPFSICRLHADGSWSIVYRAQGRGTALLAKVKPGAAVDMLGPLGHGFTIPDEVPQAPVALVGGGVGVPPLVFLADKLRQAGVAPVALLGFASSEHAVCLEHFADLQVPVQVATIDGSLGYKGLVTEVLATMPTQPGLVYSCGPTGMLRAVAAHCQQQHIPCQVSLEERMACGVGACLSCVCPVRKDGEAEWRWQRVCQDGPVFSGAEVVFDAVH